MPRDKETPNPKTRRLSGSNSFDPYRQRRFLKLDLDLLKRVDIMLLAKSVIKYKDGKYTILT